MGLINIQFAYNWKPYKRIPSVCWTNSAILCLPDPFPQKKWFGFARQVPPVQFPEIVFTKGACVHVCAHYFEASFPSHHFQTFYNQKTVY